MDSTVFKYNHHQQHQQQHQHHYNSSNNIQNNNNQNSIFILNTATNNILANNPKLHYTDFNDNNNVESSSSSSNNVATSSSSSVWSSASSTMCSPAAHAIQKLFNCSSNSLKLNQGNYSGIESKTFKSKSEILKKKSKFWKYLEGETNENISNNNQPPAGIDVTRTKEQEKSRKHKYWSKSYDSDNQNPQDLSELLEYSCSLCDNCRCIDCQIAYFDCDNSDDSNSEYSFHMNAYEEDYDDVVLEKGMELKICKENHNTKQTLNGCNKMDNNNAIHKLDSKQFNSYQQLLNYEPNENCDDRQCCQQCCLESGVEEDDTIEGFPITQRDH